MKAFDVAFVAGAVLLATLFLSQVTFAAEPTTSPSGEMPRLIPYSDYRGDLATRPALSGDWASTRQELMDNGLRFDLSSSFTLQGNVAGGVSNRSGTSSGLHLGIQLDTGKAHLWPGGIFKMKADGRFGTDANTATGALMPVNTEAIYPAPGADYFLLSELNYTQFLSPQIGFTLGKYSLREANVFAQDETDQFMNTAFNFDPVASTTIPLSALGAGIIVLPTPDWTIATMALDSEGTAKSAGFDTAFERGTTFLQTYQLAIKPASLPGHQRIGWTYSDRSRIAFSQDPREIIGGIITGPAALGRESNDWSVFYDFDQYLYTVPGAADRGWGLFGRVGVGDDQVNPAHLFYSLGIGGKGPWDVRPNDSFGAGVYYVQVTDNLPAPFDAKTRDEYGVEMYYNVAVTPWLHVTPDLQVIEPASKSTDTTVVAGMRVKVIF